MVIEAGVDSQQDFCDGKDKIARYKTYLDKDRHRISELYLQSEGYLTKMHDQLSRRPPANSIAKDDRAVSLAGAP
jgi:hypothetical protein